MAHLHCGRHLGGWGGCLDPPGVTRRPRLAVIVAGCLTLGGYGLVINMVKWDFAKLLGAYVALFAVVSVCVGRFVFKEHVPLATWLGLSLIIVGALVIQVSHESQ